MLIPVLTIVNSCETVHVGNDLIYFSIFCRVSSKYLRKIQDKRRESRKEMPTLEDFAKLNSWLKEKLEEAVKQLQQKRTAENWKEVAKLVLASLIVFNGKRGGEVAELKLKTLMQALEVREYFSTVKSQKY